jgi:formyltetrahydrofolate synthetase
MAPAHMAFPTDLEIAQKAQLKPIARIAEHLGIDPEVIEPYGRTKAKLPLSISLTRRSWRMGNSSSSRP